MLQAWQPFVWVILCATLPSLERCRQSSSIRNVLAECQTSVDMKGLVIWARDGEPSILVYETFGAIFECIDCRIGPPVGVVSILIVVAASRIKCMAELMASNGTKGSV